MDLRIRSELMGTMFFDNYSTSGGTSAALGIKKIDIQNL